MPVIRWAAAPSLLLCLLGLPGRVHAGARMAEPLRLTAGAADEMMGATDPTGARLYFASNSRATWQIFVQDMERGVPELLFDHGADATDPRVGPRGRWILYVSYLTDATGDACLYDIETEKTTCLTDERTSESQAFWFPGGEHVGVVSRTGMHGDFRLLDFALSGGPPAVVLDRNLAAPAVSPDGRWLVFVPVTRNAEVVGANFARRAAKTLALVRLDDPDRVLELRFHLSGASGFPAFSKDGKYLYFSQYLNDTNLDGIIDGDDNSVLFRVPFDTLSDLPVDARRAEQLTSARWNCQYPVPETDRLLATCAHEGSLDIYALPLEGSVPGSWSNARLEEELRSARDTWQRLLLLAHLLGRSTEPDARVEVLRRMTQAHLELREYESAEHYARLVIDRYGGVDGGKQAQLMEILLEVIAERRETQRLVQGELNLRFIRDQQKRLERLLQPVRGGDAMAAMALIAASEVNDTIGEKGRARDLLEQVDIGAIGDPFVVSAFGDRASGLYQELGLTGKLLETLRALSDHPALAEAERLEFARRFVRALTKGAPVEERVARVARWRERVAPESPLAMVLEAEGLLLGLSPESEEAVRKGLYELYRRTSGIERRRVLVEMIVERAVTQDSDYLLYEFSNTWVSWLKRASSERQYAEALYREVLLARVYVSQAGGDFADARGYAYGLTRQTDALEAHIAFIENWDNEGRKDVAGQYAKQFRSRQDDPVYGFVRAYLVARTLQALEGEALEAGIGEARAVLQEAAPGLPRRVEVHHLQGYLAHLDFLRTGDAGFAQEANTHYLLALDLARSNPRYQATLLQSLGLLQGQVDSHRIALDYFARRDRLPYVDPEQALCIMLASARSLFHAGRLDEAAERTVRALDWVDGHPDLERFRPLALSRAALYHYAAGRDAAAWTYYLELEPWMAREDTSDEGQRTRVQLLVGKGAVAQRIGKHEEALEAFRAARERLDTSEGAFEVRERENGGRRLTYGAGAYRRLLDGLVAGSLEALGRLDEAAEAMARRKSAFAERFEKTDLDEDLWEIAAACHHLARYAYQAGDSSRALEAAEEGWVYAVRYNRRTGSDVSDISLRLLADFAELHLYGKLPGNAMSVRLERELRAAYEVICRRRSPAWAPWRFLFEVYLTMLEVGR